MKLQESQKRQRVLTSQQMRDNCEHRRYVRNSFCQHARVPTTVNVNGDDSISSPQPSTGLLSNSSLHLNRYLDLSYDTSKSNEHESTSARTRGDSFQSSTLGRANNSNWSPPLSQFSCYKTNDDIEVEGALATAHDNHYIVDPDDIEFCMGSDFWHARYWHSSISKSALAQQNEKNERELPSIKYF